jgi:hypothetical protein
MEETLSPRESLDLIVHVIGKTKESLRGNSFGFLLWGWLIAIASFTFFFLHQYTPFRFYFVPFPVLTTIGILSTAIWMRKQNTRTTLPYTTYFINKMWVVLGVCFIMVVFINVSQGHLPFTYTLIIAGIGTLVSGWVLKFRPLVIGGILLFLASIVSVYVADAYKPLVQGVAIVAGFLIPGYLLKKEKV